MTIPQLPSDILSEIFTHFFGSIQVPAKGSCSLLLVSKSIRTLALPFFWRSLTIHRPSDFVSLFDPKVGLLHVKGKVGKQRQEWVRELSLGKEAAVPYDLDKIAKAFKKKKGIDANGKYELHVKLKPAKLPNLKYLSLEPAVYLTPCGSENDPSYLDLANRFALADEEDAQKMMGSMRPQEAQDMADARQECGFGEYFSMSYLGFFNHLVARNDELIGSLLTSSVVGELTSLHLPLAPHLGWNPEDYESQQKTTKDLRIPTNLEEAKELVVTLHYGKDKGGFFDDDLAVARTVSAQIPSKARVRVASMKERESSDLVSALEKAQKKDLERFKTWELVEEDGSVSPLIPSL